MVGAPRAQSSLEAHRKINESGAVYKCSLNENLSECKPFIVDPEGNSYSDNPYAYTAVNKNYQFLGAAMDGHGSESSRFVVCAPNVKTDSLNEDFLFHGICFVTDNTLGDGPVNKYEVAPLRAKSKLYFNIRKYTKL